MYLRFIVYAVISIALQIINYPFAFVVAAFGDENGNLPAWLQWATTPDNTLDGDENWKSNARWFRDNTGACRYLNRVGWLWRNGMYGLGYSLLGAKRKPEDWLGIDGDPLTSDRPFGHAGVVRRYLIRNGETKYFQYYRIYRWGNLNKCLRLNFGWKLWDWHTKTVYQFVFSFGLWNTFTPAPTSRPDAFEEQKNIPL